MNTAEINPQKDTYAIWVRCGNCGHPNLRQDGRVEIPKGTRVEDFPCPICGCRDLRRVVPS